MSTDPTARECGNCGGRIVPMARSRTGYRHAADQPECEVKPPLPAYAVDELVTEWVTHPTARRRIRDGLERLREERDELQARLTRLRARDEAAGAVLREWDEIGLGLGAPPSCGPHCITITPKMRRLLDALARTYENEGTDR